jgi:protein-disulfide isomerase
MWAAPLLLLVAAAACGAQTPREMTIDPVMVKGPAGAPVTIVEFSDYQ